MVPAPSVVWPDLSAVTPANLMPLINQIGETQFLSVARREAVQHDQLGHLARFAAAHSPHFRARLDDAGLEPEDMTSPEGLRKLPPLSRRALQQDLQAMDCRPWACGHGPFGTTQTSGSSGEPVVVYRGAVSQAFWLAYTLRDHRWHERDFSGTLAVIRANLGVDGPIAAPDWGAPATLFNTTGPCHALPINTDISAQVRWLTEVDPDYLLLYPNNLAALLDAADEGALRLGKLKQVRTVGETLSQALRDRVAAVFGVETVDMYSSQEAGVIALQCPVSGRYHAMESVIVEIVDDNGEPCLPGAVGRVLVTDLHNFATPLVRYDIGDYAEAGSGAVCDCGRGLQSITRIAGRERNIARLADGRKFWPLVGFHAYRSIADIRQYQIVQHDYDHLEIRLVCDQPLSRSQEQDFRSTVCQAFGHRFGVVDFTYFDRNLPRGANGKFEEFVCRIS